MADCSGIVLPAQDACRETTANIILSSPSSQILYYNIQQSTNLNNFKVKHGTSGDSSKPLEKDLKKGVIFHIRSDLNNSWHI